MHYTVRDLGQQPTTWMRTGCCATDANQQRSQHSARLGLQPGPLLNNNRSTSPTTTLSLHRTDLSCTHQSRTRTLTIGGYRHAARTILCRLTMPPPSQRCPDLAAARHPVIAMRPVSRSTRCNVRVHDNHGSMANSYLALRPRVPISHMAASPRSDSLRRSLPLFEQTLGLEGLEDSEWPSHLALSMHSRKSPNQSPHRFSFCLGPALRSLDRVAATTCLGALPLWCTVARLARMATALLSLHPRPRSRP